MSRLPFALALPFVVAAAPLVAQGYYPSQQPYYDQAPAQPQPSVYPPQRGPYQPEPQQRYSSAPQPYYADPREARPVQAAAQVDDGPALPPPPKPAIDRLEQMMWQAAAQANAIDGYSTYLNRYPDGAHAGEARAAVEQIRRSPPAPRIAVAEAAAAPAAAPVPAAASITIASATAAPVKPMTDTLIGPGGKALPIAPIATAPVPVAPSDTIEPAAPAAKPIVVAQAMPIATAATASVAAASIQAGSDPTPFVCRPAYAGEAPYDQAGETEIGAYLAAIRMNSIGAYETYLQAYPHGVFAPEVLELVAARQGRIAMLAKLATAGPVAARARAQVRPGERDYPTMALRDGQEGKATAIWEVAEDGCVEACRIDRSSGSLALDAATCRAVTSHGRYDPALDAQGHPVRSVDSATFTWKLPVH